MTEKQVHAVIDTALVRYIIKDTYSMILLLPIERNVENMDLSHILGDSKIKQQTTKIILWWKHPR